MQTERGPVSTDEKISMRLVAAFCRLIPIRSGIGTVIQTLSSRLPELLSHPGFRFVLFESHDQEVKAFVQSRISDQSRAYYGVCRSLFRTRLFRIANKEDVQNAHDILAVQLAKDTNHVRIRSVRDLRNSMA